MSASELANLVAIALVSGPFAAIVAQLLKRERWPAGLKAALALAVAGAVGIAQSWISGDLVHLSAQWGQISAAQVLTLCGGVYASAQLWYHTYLGSAGFMAHLAAWPKRA